MEESRRRILWLGFGLFVTGCSSQMNSHSSLDRPDVDWPDSPSRPRTTKSTPPSAKTAAQSTASAPKKTIPSPQSLSAEQKNPPAPTAQAPAARAPGPFVANANAKTSSGGPKALMGLNATPAPIYIPRTRWADQGPMMERIVPMGDVNRITLHHEGWNPVVFSDEETTAERLELIRRSHIQRLGAGDIGYHFVVDRAGRIWEGREAKFQGAHVRGNNEHNIGIMCLGNFDIQSPSPEQLRTLITAIKTVQAYYKVPGSRVKTHQEINPTACPGKVLQAYIVQLRKNNTLA